MGNHPNREGGVLEKKVVSQPLTFAIITREKKSPIKAIFLQLCWGEGGSGEVGMVSQVEPVMTFDGFPYLSNKTLLNHEVII